MTATIFIAIFLLLTIGVFFLAKATKRNATVKAEARNAEIAELRSTPGYNSRYDNDLKQVEPKAWADSSYGFVPAYVAVIPLIVAALIAVFTCQYHVDAKDVAVVKSFGKPVGQAGPGLHLKAPWESTVNIDGTTQVDEYSGDHCLAVRIGDGSQSCLSATVRWHINLDQADNIYASYRSNDPTGVLRSAVVDTQFKAAAQDVLSQYNPVAQLQVVEGDDAGGATKINFNPDYDATSKELSSQMDERLGQDPTVVIDSITVSGLSLADSTQQTLNKFIQAVGETRVAAQDKVTKAQEAEGNKALAQQALSPEVLESKCYDTVIQALQAGYQLPAGFNCVGSGSVVVPSSK